MSLAQGGRQGGARWRRRGELRARRPPTSTRPRHTRPDVNHLRLGHHMHQMEDAVVGQHGQRPGDGVLRVLHDIGGRGARPAKSARQASAPRRHPLHPAPDTQPAAPPVLRRTAAPARGRRFVPLSSSLHTSLSSHGMRTWRLPAPPSPDLSTDSSGRWAPSGGARGSGWAAGASAAPLAVTSAAAAASITRACALVLAGWRCVFVCVCVCV